MSSTYRRVLERNTYAQELYPSICVKDLLWIRKWHQLMIREIDQQLLALSKKHEIVVCIEEGH